MEPIGREVRRALSRLGPQGAIADVVAAWPAAVGATIARNAWPGRLARDGTLHVVASSSTWAFELGQLAPRILERLREELGAAAPGALRFAAGPLPDWPATVAAEPRVERLEPGPHELARGEELAAAVGDGELRAAIARAAAASLILRADDRPV